MAAVVSFPETGSRKAILTLENGESVELQYMIFRESDKA